MFSAALDTLVGEVYEHHICQGVDDLGGIVRGIVVLLESVYSILVRLRCFLVPLRTIVECL